MKLRTWCIRMGQILTKTVLVFTGFLVFLTLFNPAILQAEDGRGGITIRHENVPIQKVFQSIEKQSGYRFFYNETLLQGAIKVTLNLQNVTLQEALDACFRNQPLSYAIVDKTIIVKRRAEQQSIAPIPTAVSFTTPNKGKLIAVRGKVTSNNIPVAGASIMIKGTDNGASTDKDGIFTLAEVDEEATLVVSSVSHQAREVKLNGQSFILVDLDKKDDDLDEAVVVAYNTTTKRMNTGSVAVIKGADVQSIPNRSVDKSLQGLVPGLLVTSGTGQPGGGLSNFVLRGIATGSTPDAASTVRNPLIVVDGVPVSQDNTQWVTNLSETPVINPMSQLNPADIESITVLKDASAIALYGSKASNGVILITTKKGKAGKTVFNFRNQTDIAERLKGKIELLNQDEYLQLLYETYKNTARNPSPWTDDLILADLKTKFLTRADGSFYPETDWENELYKSRATTISNNLSVSGGNDKSNYFLNLEYSKQDGIFKKTGYDRKSVRFNFESRPAEWLKLGLNSTLSYNIQDYAFLTGGTFPIGMATNFPPLVPARKEDGTLILNYTFPFQVSNPLAAMDYNINRNTSYRGLSKLYGEISFLKYFKLSSTVGVDFMMVEAKEKVDPRLYDYYTRAANSGRIQERATRNANLINTNMLRSDYRIKDDHSINVLLGQEAQIQNMKYQMATATGLKFPTYDQISNGSTRSSEGSASKQTLLSYFGQLNYGYRDKYFLTSSIRKDGSSKFGDRQRFGTYWSTGLGYVLTAEPFMKGTSNWLNYLKIRGSVGSAGNSGPVDRFTRYDVLGFGNFLNTSMTAVYPGASPANPNIRWEETFTMDAGLEARFLGERIGITADIYKRKTSDLIYAMNLPLVTGYTTILDNIGNMNNKGIELSLNADVIKSKNFTWNINANWSTNKNILIKANVPLVAISGGMLGNEVGRNFNSFYMVRWAGVNPDDGNPQWLDSADNVTTVFPTAQANKKFVGKPQPDGFGAVTSTFNYKDFQLSAMFYYQYGFQIYDASGLINDGLSPYNNQDKRALDYWKKPGDVAANPKRSLNNLSTINSSTRFLYDGDFIRLQNVTLSYRLPKSISSMLHLSAFRVYAQGQNLALWTKFPGGDLSNTNVQGNVGLSYPNQRTFSLGVNVNF